MTQHILVVDDHSEIRDLLGRYLAQHGFEVSQADGGQSMRELVKTEVFDLIVLDIMMPGEDGLSLCRYLREQKGPPVIMLTAMSEGADTIVGLEMGADDYVTKPFNPRELLARIKAVLRRMEQARSQTTVANPAKGWRFNRWLFALSQRQLERDDGLLVPLSAAEYRLLTAFINNANQVLSRDQLMDLTKGRDAQPFDRSIDNQISRLRKKIEDDARNPILIKTVWGGGYIFTARAKRA